MPSRVVAPGVPDTWWFPRVKTLILVVPNPEKKCWKMDAATREHRTITKFEQETHLLTWLEAFQIDRKSQGLAHRTVDFYRLKLNNFSTY